MADQYNSLKKYAFAVLAVLLSVFVTTAANTTLFVGQPGLAIFGMLGTLLILIDRPLIKRWADTWPVRIIDWCLYVGTVVTFGYIFVQNEKIFESIWIDGKILGERAGEEVTIDFAIAFVGLILVLEATRRAIAQSRT